MTRKVVITGGSSGLGLALAKALVRRGDAVAIIARDQRKLDSAAAEIRAASSGAQVIAQAVDVTRADELAAAFAAISSALGGIDVLVNSAGVLREGYFETIPEAQHRESMEINYFGALNAIRAVLPYLKKSAQPHIVNISSISGLSGAFGYSAYCPTKYALLGLSETLRIEFAPQGIKVQVVCPGEFDSPMVDALDLSRTPENREHTLTIPKVSVDVVVRDTVRGMDGDAFMIVPGVQARVSVFGLQHFPGISRRVSDSRVRSVYVGPGK